MIGYVLWALLFAGVAVLEGLSVTVRSHQWPSFSDLMRAVMRPELGRWIVFALWLWLGWHLFMRGWSFFLRGQGARSPVKGLAPGTTVIEILQQIVLPLVVAYSALMAMLWAAYRTRRSGRLAVSLSQAALRMKRRRAGFVRYTVLTLVGGYSLFVVIIASYQLVAGRTAGGMAGSALVDGAFLTFAVALPAFVAGSLVFGALAGRRGRGGATPVDA